MNFQRNRFLRIGFCFLLGIAVAVICWYDLRTISDYIGYGKHIVILFCILSFAGGFCLIGSVRWLYSQRWSPFRIIMLLVLCFYFSFSVTGMETLYLDALFNIFRIELFTNILTTVLWVVPIVICGLRLYSNLCFLGLVREKANKRIFLLIALLVMCCELILLLVALNPAVTAKMSYNSIFYAKKLFTMQITEWISPFYYLLLHLLLPVCRNVTGLVILQYGCYILAVLFILNFFLDRGIKLQWLIIMLVYLVTNISLQVYLISIFPDAMYIVALIWLFYLLLRIVDAKADDNKHYRIAALVFLSAFIGLIRQNGIVVAVGTVCIVAAVCFKKNKRYILVPIVSIFIILLVRGPVYDSMQIQRTPHEKYLAMMNDIFNTYYAKENVSEEVDKLINSVTGGKPEEYKYTQFKANYNTEGYHIDALREYSLPQFLKIYMENLFSHPKSVITAMLCRTEQVWSLSQPLKSFTVVQYPLNERGDNEEKIEVVQIPERKSNVLTAVFESVFAIIRQTDGILYKIYWRGNFLYSVLLFCVFALYLNRPKGNWIVLLLVLPIMLNILSLLAGGGWPDYRYHAPAIVLVPVAFIYCGYRLNISGETKEYEQRKNGIDDIDAMPE